MEAAAGVCTEEVEAADVLDILVEVAAGNHRVGVEVEQARRIHRGVQEVGADHRMLLAEVDHTGWVAGGRLQAA